MFILKCQRHNKGYLNNSQSFYKLTFMTYHIYNKREIDVGYVRFMFLFSANLANITHF